MAEKKRSWLRTTIVIAVLLGGLAYLFVTSLETTRAEPYEVNRANLRGWELSLEQASGAGAPLLTLKTDIALVSNLFRQLFLRTMESMSTPSGSMIPVVMQEEFVRALQGRMTPAELLGAARAAGLENAAHEPRCMVHRRISEPGSTRQVYAVLVDSPSITRFREGLTASTDGLFDAAAVPTVMIVGASDDAFHRWLPLGVSESDCLAPVTLSGG